MLDETPGARKWLEATTRKFETDLLPKGLAPDGAQIEGATFWASTMQYRIFFLDALRHVTGNDLLKKFENAMNADLALAAIASEKFPGHDQSYANVAWEPYYGQLDYYAPVLLFLAREYHRPTFQYLARWDHSLGGLQKTRAITPHGEQLLFELGGYAYLWCDETVPAKAQEKRLSYAFPSVDEAYARTSWKPGDLLVSVSKGKIMIHAGGLPVLFEPEIIPGNPSDPSTNALRVQSLEDNGVTATIRCGRAQTNQIKIELNRRTHTVVIHRNIPGPWQWSCHGQPTRKGNELRWKNRVTVRVVTGSITEFNPSGYAPVLATGFNKLKLADPAPMKFPMITVSPSVKDEIILQVRGP